MSYVKVETHHTDLKDLPIQSNLEERSKILTLWDVEVGVLKVLTEPQVPFPDGSHDYRNRFHLELGECDIVVEAWERASILLIPFVLRTGCCNTVLCFGVLYFLCGHVPSILFTSPWSNWAIAREFYWFLYHRFEVVERDKIPRSDDFHHPVFCSEHHRGLLIQPQDASHLWLRGPFMFSFPCLLGVLSEDLFLL